MANETLPTTQRIIDQLIESTPLLKEGGTVVKDSIHQVVISNEATRTAADLLHGKWLGHPLHAVLVEVVVGAWSLGLLADMVALVTRSRSTRDTADTLHSIGTALAVPTALAGMTDYSGIKKDAVGHGTLHAILNSVALVLQLLSLQARRRKERGAAVFLSAVGVGGLGLISAWLGGELVYRHRVGVNHAPAEDGQPEDWTVVMADAGLKEGERLRVEVKGKPILFYRANGEIYAISAVCNHAGGPLEQGKFYDNCVQCPWHDSIFDLRNGAVVHGPAVYDEPAYLTRVNGPNIEIKAIKVSAGASLDG